MEKLIQIIILSLVGILMSSVFSLLSALVVWPVWNWLMPDIFGLPAIGYWQAFGLGVLSTLLLKFNTSIRPDRKKE